MFRLLLFACVMLPLCGCGTMPTATGRDFEVVVMVDGDNWDRMSDQIKDVLERPIFGVSNERTFRLIQTLPDNPEPYQIWRKVLVLGSVKDTPLLQDLLREEELKNVEPGKAYLKTLSDVWAYGQFVLVCYAQSSEDLPGAFESSSESIFSLLNDAFIQEERIRMFTSGENTELEEYFADTYDFSITLPKIYRLADEDTLVVSISDQDSIEMRAVRFFNLNPQRSFLVCWKEGSLGSLQVEKIRAMRQAIGRIYYPGDELVISKIDASPADFRGLDALRIRGVWENREELQGGIFISYAFNCPWNDRFYLIDGILYMPDPEKSKYPYLVQISMILHSLSCSADISRNVAAEEAGGYLIDTGDLF